MTNLGNNSNGVPFNSRIVRKGDRYGRNNCLTHTEDDPLVEFYDARYDYTELGQFVSSYSASTLTGECEWSFGSDSRETGLNLEGSVSDWFVDADQVKLALADL